MTRSTGSPEPNASEQSSATAAPILVWTALQLSALALAAARVPLWARVNSPIESTALPLMLATQAAGSALLFPWLLRSLSAAVLAISMSVVFVQLAGLLGVAPIANTGVAAIGMILWLTGLAVWIPALRTQHSQAIAVAIVASVVIGAAGLNYLAMESALKDWMISGNPIWIIICANLVVSAAARGRTRSAHAPSYPQR
jgi:hypothetical protein